MYGLNHAYTNCYASYMDIMLVSYVWFESCLYKLLLCIIYGHYAG